MQVHYLEIVTKDVDAVCATYAELHGVTFGNGDASLGGALRGAGDVRYVLGVITVTAWLVRVPIAIILTVFLGMGAPGAWIGATTENIVRGGLIWGRFRAGHWKEKVV